MMAGWHSGNDIAITAGSLSSILGSIESYSVSPTARRRCDFYSELSAKAPSGGDGPRHSLHASSWYGEFNEDWILLYEAMSYFHIQVM